MKLFFSMLLNYDSDSKPSFEVQTVDTPIQPNELLFICYLLISGIYHTLRKSEFTMSYISLFSLFDFAVMIVGSLY